MSNKSLPTIISAIVLMSAGAAYAGDTNKSSAIQQQFIAKRPYQQVIAAGIQQDVQWEGATLIGAVKEHDETRLQQRNALRLAMVGKRPY